GLHDRRPVDREPPHGEQEHIHGIGEKRQADHHRKGAAPEQEINAHGREQADAGGDKQLHAHGRSSLRCARATADASRGSCRSGWPGARSARASTRAIVASEISTTPTTVENTPTSKAMAEASSNSPMIGRCT